MGHTLRKPEKIIYLCSGSSCKKKGGKDLGKLFSSFIKKSGLKGKVKVIKTKCTDNCKLAAVAAIQPENIWLTNLTGNEQDAYKIFEEHILNKI